MGVALCGLVHARLERRCGAGRASRASGRRRHWPLPPDARLEARVDALLKRMTLEEKVGQTIQADIGSVTPDDVRRYRLGSILAGGNSKPAGRRTATPAQWQAEADAFYAASMDTSQGHVAIPILFGIDAVHGDNSTLGATLFPQNSALGATRDPALLRAIGAATAEEVRATGLNWSFAPTLAVPQDDRWGRTYEGYSEDPRRRRRLCRRDGARACRARSAPRRSSIART